MIAAVVWLCFQVFQGITASRVQGSQEGDHSSSFEIEHDLSLHWPVDQSDLPTLEKIIEMLNPADKDADWVWKNERGSWTFGAVKMLGGTPKETLAFHMLHRHGLAPLLAARAGEAFQVHHKQSVEQALSEEKVARCCCKKVIAMDACKNDVYHVVWQSRDGQSWCCKARAQGSVSACDLVTGYTKPLSQINDPEKANHCPRLPPGLLEIDAVVASEESFDQVVAMKGLLDSLTLSSLRNLHSFDHAWSVTHGTGKDPDCTAGNPGPCVLQAGYSPLTHKFMEEHGFNKNAVEAALRRQGLLFPRMVLGMLNPLGSLPALSFTSNYMQPDHTGKIRSNAFDPLRVEGQYIQGMLSWEDGGASEVKVKLTKAQRNELKSLKEQGTEIHGRMVEIVEEWIDQQYAGHSEFANANRFSMWSGEEAEFYTLAGQALGTASTLDAQSLRPGWLAKEDPESGKPLYYNKYSGKSQWERPVFGS